MPQSVLNLHAQRQALRRAISIEEIDFVLEHFDARRDAAARRTPPVGDLIASVRGNRLRVYAVKDALHI